MVYIHTPLRSTYTGLLYKVDISGTDLGGIYTHTLLRSTYAGLLYKVDISGTDLGGIQGRSSA